MKPTPPLLVVGLGNLLMEDDGIGCHVAAALQADPPDDTLVLDAGTSVIQVVPYLERAEAVLFVDAFNGGGAPGTLYEIDAREVAEPPPGSSLHTVGLTAALRWMSPETRTKTMTLLGVEPARIDYGTELSTVLQSALPAALRAARIWLQRSRETLSGVST